MMKSGLIFLAALAIPMAAAAHHGWSSYDTDRVLRLEGRFTAVSWSNPHGTATMTWRGRPWRIVLAPIARMEARGLRRTMIAPGKRVGLVGYPRRDGTREMRIERITAEGKTVELR
jgi:hypothetical protein